MILKTKRLIIRNWTHNDLESAFKLWGDPYVMRFIDSRGGLNLEQVQEKLQSEIKQGEEFGVQYWAAFDKKSSEIIGCCGLRPYLPEEDVFEIGFHICSAHWRKGYASEAAKEVIRFACEEMKVKKLFAGHNPNNTSSASLLLKLGFKYIGDQFYAPTGLMHPSYELLNL